MRQLVRLRRNAALITAAGLWTCQMQLPVRRNLRWVWFDGLFGQVVDSITQSDTSLFVLALGGTGAQIGLIGTLKLDRPPLSVDEDLLVTI